MRSRTLTLCGIGLAGLSLCDSRTAFAKWKPLGAGLGTTGNDVYALTVFDGKLIAGGNFETAGGQEAERVAAWDGELWHPLGEGMNSAVYALTVYNDELIAGGPFTTADGQTVNHIARWDGKSWQPLGDGMSDLVWGYGVQSLCVHDGALIAGGDFTTAGSANANFIARWDGKSWQPLGDGMDGYVRAVTVSADQLVAGGQYIADGKTYHVASWNGSSWTHLSGFGNYVNVLAVHDDELTAGGEDVAQWNGSSWDIVGAGLNPQVISLVTYQNDLIAGGSFVSDEGSGFLFSRIARWTGSAWETMDSGMNHEVSSLTVFNEQLIAGGSFTIAGGEPASRIARWAPCVGDATEDDVVDVDDLLTVINFWGNPKVLDGIADVNNDGLVDVDDLLAVINAWGPCP